MSRWKLIPNLWMHKTVNVTCPGTAVRSLSPLSNCPLVTQDPCTLELIRQVIAC